MQQTLKNSIKVIYWTIVWRSCFWCIFIFDSQLLVFE